MDRAKEPLRSVAAQLPTPAPSWRGREREQAGLRQAGSMFSCFWCETNAETTKAGVVPPCVVRTP